MTEKMSGWRFEPPLSGEISDTELGRWLGTHNLNCVVFRNDSQEIVGCKLSCQCTDCVVAQAELVISRGSELLGLGAHTTSIVFERENSKAVQFLERDRSALEDKVEARKLAERQRDLREKAVLAGKIDKLAKHFEDQLQQAQTGGLVRDKNGRVWTRNQLITMAQAQQREDAE